MIAESKVNKTRPKYGGRTAGTPNKLTQEAREAIALFVNDNAHRLTEWLDTDANGDPGHDIKPNPAKAFELSNRWWNTMCPSWQGLRSQALTKGRWKW